ncbi:MAG TPA: SdpI family protein [Thermomicrobiales bacterium]|jgi:hypothetical protein
MAGWIGVLVPGAIGLLFVIVGIPLAQRRVPRNAWYGYRIRTTLKDDAIWYPVNERSGRHLIVLGGALILVALVGLSFTGDDATQRDLLILSLALTAAGLAYSIWSGYALARLLDREQRISAG